MSGKVPMDHGYAWIIAAVSTSLFALGVGGLKCQGLILMELSKRFEGVYTTSTLLWIFTIVPIVAGFSGPLVTWLAIKLTHRAVSMMGVIIVCASNISLAYCPNFLSMIFLSSLPGGIGLRILMTSPVLMVWNYFEKKIAIAVGIMAGGSGIGTLVIPNILKPLFDHMDFNGAMIMYGAFTLQFVWVAAFLRPAAYYTSVREEKDSSWNTTPTDVQTPDTDDSSINNVILPMRIRSASFHHHTLGSHQNNVVTFHSDYLVRNRNISRSEEKVVPLQPTLIMSLSEIAGSYIILNNIINSSANLDSTNTDTSSTQENSKVNKFNWKVLLLPKFLLLCATIMIYTLGASVVYQCAPAFAAENGIPMSQVVIVLMVAGGLEIPFRIANGYLVDKKVMTATHQFTLSISLASILILLCAFISGLTGLILVLVAMSALGTSHYALLTCVLTELVGLENLASALGIQIVFQSVALIVTTFITGYIYETSGTWQMVYFYIASTMLLASAIMVSYCIYSWVSERRRPATTECNESAVINADI